jgi:hypothetical protein
MTKILMRMPAWGSADARARHELTDGVGSGRGQGKHRLRPFRGIGRVAGLPVVEHHER